jgi:hypothetical protein
LDLQSLKGQQGVWSPDSRWIVYDTRSDPAGAVFDGETIEAVS